MKKLKSILGYLWELPQNVIGLIWRGINSSRIVGKAFTDDINSVGANAYLMKNVRGAVTMGRYIFLSQCSSNKMSTIKHECGHVRQSKILGPLYLIVIGIPSILHAWLNNCIGCCRKNGKYNYYHFYTEHILMGEFDLRGT